MSECERKPERASKCQRGCVNKHKREHARVREGGSKPGSGERVGQGARWGIGEGGSTQGCERGRERGGGGAREEGSEGEGAREGKEGHMSVSVSKVKVSLAPSNEFSDEH